MEQAVRKTFEPKARGALEKGKGTIERIELDTPTIARGVPTEIDAWEWLLLLRRAYGGQVGYERS